MAVQRYSRQRELIYHAVLSSKAHPTAEMVYAALKPACPGLSRGTVYRNLHLLVREGKLRRMPFSVERFDGDARPHSHFCCEVCGGVSDVPGDYDPAQDEAVRALGHQVDRHEVVYYGVCAQCRAGGDQSNQEEEFV